MGKFILNTLFLTLLAFLLSTVVYFGFVNAYSSGIFSYKSFNAQFQSGIYQYRILSGHLLNFVYDILSRTCLNFGAFRLKFLNKKAEPQMYVAFYVLNTVFLMLSAGIYGLISARKNFVATNSEKILIGAVLLFTICITEFVIVPYDCSSYFFLLLFFWIFTEYLEKEKTLYLVLSALIIIISTFNRESSALSLALAGTLLFQKNGISIKAILPLGILAGSFIAVYLGLRFVGDSFTTNDGSLLTQNFTDPKNLLGILFWLCFSVFSLLVSKDASARRNIILFHILSVPYIAMCFYTGILYEMRLYVPLFVTAVLIAKYSI